MNILRVSPVIGFICIFLGNYFFNDIIGKCLLIIGIIILIASYIYLTRKFLLDRKKYPELFNIIQDLMKSYSLDRVKVLIWPFGFNAFAISFYGDTLIVTKELLEEMNYNEMKAIIAHEFSHLYHRDSVLVLALVLIFLAPFLFVITFFIPKNQIISLPSAIAFFISLFILIYGFKIINWIKIDQELGSDREAVLHVNSYKDLQNALFKMYNYIDRKKRRPTRVGAIFTGFDYISEYFFGTTHPRLKERIEHIEFAGKIRASMESQ